MWSPRAQVDKIQYSQFVCHAVENNKNINIMNGEVIDVRINASNRVVGAVVKDGKTIECSALIITAGTFLNGLIHIGNKTFPAGRMGEKPSKGLTESLKKYSFRVGRLKTGTPPRLLASSIDWKATMIAPGDDAPFPFSLNTDENIIFENDPCHIVHTNRKLHTILNENLKQSAMFSGKIQGVGPRYCPSIEDKIVRFSSRDSHQLFLEPEWKNSKQIYVNGFSTSMPSTIQLQALQTIEALKKVEIIRPGYAIEYDYIPSSQIKSTLESKILKNMYLSGQINGTSGYEEAAAQGLIAGINAALKIQGKDPFILKRSDAYIGVLIDDLITKTIDEPYRMFTSRAEYRLSLRADTSYARLTARAHEYGMISKNLFSKFQLLDSEINTIKKLLDKKIEISGLPPRYARELLLNNKHSISSLLQYIPKLKSMSKRALFTSETNIKYEGYVAIEKKRVKKIQSMENQKIPEEFDYNQIDSLSSESKQKLVAVKPETVGQASRISGVRASDISLLCIKLKQFNVPRETL